jgi:Fe2+ or Zn2+ uptake regulation protein
MSIFTPLRKGSADRQARMNKLKILLSNKGEKTVDQILGQFCYEESISIRMAREYLHILELAGIVNTKESE